MQAVPILSTRVQIPFEAWTFVTLFYHIMTQALRKADIRRRIQKFSDWVDNEINSNNNKHSLRSNTKCYGGKTHYLDSQNIDTTTPSGRELYHLQFLLQATSPETFRYTIVQSEYLIIPQLSKKFLAFYETRRLITVFTRVRHRIPSWANYNFNPL
jgi:hypothetical protein